DDLKNAMRAKDQLRLSVLRLLKSAITNKEIEKKDKELSFSDDEVMLVINTEAKKRRDSIESYTSNNRPEAAQQEEAELEILMEYLPQQLSKDELMVIIKEGIARISLQKGAINEKDFGLIMKDITPQIKGLADGSLVAKLVKEMLVAK
ncbi:MAG: GatB/YqeY domain-containing protein, partial [Candidatus Staskawiczbacteria bacterium]|nr:GatB/YqeY domain-containing protein [Candidatus Staskawiczbacteria bacterium]